MHFVDYFNKSVTPVRIIYKRHSTFMRFLAMCLWVTDKLRITSIGNFYGYVTTIGKTIYGGPEWSNNMDVSPILLHELTHVYLPKKNRFYKFGYVVSKRRRAYYESVCFQTEMLYNPSLMTPEYIQLKAEQLKHYGCKLEDAKKEMRQRLLELECSRPQLCAAKVFDAYEAWKAHYSGV